MRPLPTRAFVACLVAFTLIPTFSCTRRDKQEIPPPPPNPMTLEETGGEAHGGKLVVAVNAETNGWDALSNQFSQAGSMIAGSVMETLGFINADGVVEPWLALDWTPNAKRDEWDIRLREGVKYHDGTPFNADNVKVNLDQRVKRSATKRSGVEYNITGVSTRGEYGVHVVLREPHAQLDVALAGFYMEPTKQLLAPETDNTNPQQTEPVGTGPFMFVEWIRGQKMVLKKNPNYWRWDEHGSRLPYLDTLEFRPIPDEETRAKALRAGDVDMIQSFSAWTATDLRDEFTVIKDFHSERTFVLLNTMEGQGNSPNPFTNEHARAALAYATDREDLVRRVGPPGSGVTSTVQPYRATGDVGKPNGSQWAIPAGEEGYPSFDLKSAREQVDLYRQETGKDLKFDLVTSGSDGREILQVVQEQWRQVGIDVQLKDVDQATLIILLLTGQFQATGMRWFSFPNPEQNTPLVDPRQVEPIGRISLAFNHYKSTTMAENLKELQESTEFNRRLRASTEIWQEANFQKLNIWLYDTPLSIITRHGVRGLNRWRQNSLSFGVKPGWFGEVSVLP